MHKAGHLQCWKVYTVLVIITHLFNVCNSLLNLSVHIFNLCTFIYTCKLHTVIGSRVTTTVMYYCITKGAVEEHIPPVHITPICTDSLSLRKILDGKYPKRSLEKIFGKSVAGILAYRLEKVVNLILVFEGFK